MNDQRDLRTYYQRELTYLRRMGAEFAKRYPKIAERLELGEDQSADPHVERLIEAFAFLTGRIQRQLDGGFPEITTALLDLLYPHYLNPVPSMAIARFEVDPEQGQLTAGYTIDKHTPLFARSTEGLTCRFRTCYPVTLWPLEVTDARFEPTDSFDFLARKPEVLTVLRLKLECRGTTLGELELERLRFYLSGERRTVNALYEMLFSHVRGVVIWDAESKAHLPLWEADRKPSASPQDVAISPVGFGVDEEVLPYPNYSQPAYRLLQEYFAFAEKFHFFEVTHLDKYTASGEILNDETLDILILLDSIPGDRLVIDRDTFRLGCTPIINLFNKTAEPIRLDYSQSEYRLVPDLRQERTTEIHSILSVSAASDPADKPANFEPFYSFTHSMERSDHKAFWHARRRPTGRADLPGAEIYLSFLDLDFNPSLPPAQTVYAHTLCTNRDLAEHIATGPRLRPDGPRLQIEDVAPLSQISFLTKPTPQLNPPLGGATLWRLISHLSLNYLSLSSGEKSLEALQEILELYDFADSPSTKKQIRGLKGMSCQKVVRRAGADPWRGFCRGIEVTLRVDEDLYTGGSAFLLASVLNHFFALYAPVNSFTQLVLRSEDREGEWMRWPPMAGEQIVL